MLALPRHCNFTALDGTPRALVDKFTALLMAMRYDDPQVRPLLDLEGLEAEYAALARACDRTQWLAPFLRQMGAA